MAQLGTITVVSVAVSIVTFAIGFVIAMKLGDAGSLPFAKGHIQHFRGKIHPDHIVPFLCQKFREECSFIWENYYDPKGRINEYDLTVFVKEGEGGLCRRFSFPVSLATT